MFRNRDDAAKKLADSLMQYQGKNPLVLAIPRGSVPMAKLIASRLGGDFDVVLVRKLRAPFNPEFAIGSIDESGWSYIGDYATAAGGTPEYIAAEKQLQLETIR
ncbi:MAG: phosphoribosyltransferase family protein, partial [Sulfuriferula sp.]